MVSFLVLLNVGVGANGGVDPSIDINIYADDMVGVTVSIDSEWGSGLGMGLTVVRAGLHHSWGTDLAWVSSLLQEFCDVERFVANMNWPKIRRFGEEIDLQSWGDCVYVHTGSRDKGQM